MALTEGQKKKIEEEEAYRAQIKEESQSQTSKKGCSGCLVAFLLIVGLLAVTLISINPAKQFENAERKTEEAVIGKHAYNKTSGAYRGEILEVKPCSNAPELTCYVVNQPTYMRPIEAPVDNSVVEDEAPTPSYAP